MRARNVTPALLLAILSVEVIIGSHQRARPKDGALLTPVHLRLGGVIDLKSYLLAKRRLWHSSMDSHSDSISANVRSCYERKEKFRVFHGSTNSTRHVSKRNKSVNTSSLSHVFEVDPESKTAIGEPNMPPDRLVEETLKYGLIPPVVMEFLGIAVGGGYAGISGESSSY